MNSEVEVPMKPKILVVDDEWSMQELLSLILVMAGFDVVLAGNEEEFRRETRAHQPDVIILDIILGNQNGVQVYEELLKEGLDPDIPVVFLSALAQDRPPTPPQPGRRYALIGKPFDSDVLVRELRSLVKT